MAGLGLGMGLGLGGQSGPKPNKPEPVSGRFAYVELPVADSEASARFFEAAFGWELIRFAPTYAGTIGMGTDLGLDADASEHSAAPLPGIQVDDLEAALEAVTAQGAAITKPIFSFPGGRRFHFREPGGNEISVFVSEEG